MADLDALLGDVLEDFDAQDAAASSQVPEGPESVTVDSSDQDDVDILADQLADEFLAGLQLASDSTEVNGLVETLMAQLSQPQSQGAAGTAPAAATQRSASQPKATGQPPNDSDMEHTFEELLKNLGEVAYSTFKEVCFQINRRCSCSKRGSLTCSDCWKDFSSTLPTNRGQRHQSRHRAAKKKVRHVTFASVNRRLLTLPKQTHASCKHCSPKSLCTRLSSSSTP